MVKLTFNETTYEFLRHRNGTQIDSTFHPFPDTHPKYCPLEHSYSLNLFLGLDQIISAIGQAT